MAGRAQQEGNNKDKFMGVRSVELAEIWQQRHIDSLYGTERKFTERKSGVILTWNVESQNSRVIGEYLSQTDSQYRISLTQIFYN